MSEDKENPLPTPGDISADSAVSPATRREGRKSRRLVRSPSLTTVTIEETGVSISAQSVRDSTFNLWLEGKRNTQKTNKLSSSISSQSADLIVNACDVRESVFQSWLAEKEHNLIKRERRKRLELFERQKLVEAEFIIKQDKRAVCYQAWCKRKDSTKPDKIKIAREISDSETEARMRTETKKLEASEMYAAWAKQTDKRRGEVLRRQRQEAAEKEIIKQESEDTKKTEAVKIYDAWRVQKDGLLRETAREKREREMKGQEHIELKKREKADNAVRAYDAWLECKEEQMSQLAELTRMQINSNDGKWKPPGPVLPDYPRSLQTRDMDTVMDGRRGQLRVTTAKHSATA